MQLKGKREDLLARIGKETPGALAALERARALAPKRKGSLMDYQAAALYALARPFDGGRIIEIGTLMGYTAAVLAQAAPRAKIVTLNPAAHEATAARAALAVFRNVTVLEQRSWDYLALDRTHYDMVFVDGDHKAVSLDLPWFDRLRAGGLMVFHDYSPASAEIPCPPVYDAVQALAARLGRLDVAVIDDRGVGLAGFYRKAGEVLTW